MGTNSTAMRMKTKYSLLHKQEYTCTHVTCHTGTQHNNLQKQGHILYMLTIFAIVKVHQFRHTHTHTCTRTQHPFCHTPLQHISQHCYWREGKAMIIVWLQSGASGFSLNHSFFQERNETSDWVIADHSIGMNGEIWQEEGERQRETEKQKEIDRSHEECKKATQRKQLRKQEIIEKDF